MVMKTGISSVAMDLSQRSGKMKQIPQLEQELIIIKNMNKFKFQVDLYKAKRVRFIYCSLLMSCTFV